MTSMTGAAVAVQHDACTTQYPVSDAAGVSVSWSHTLPNDLATAHVVFTDVATADQAKAWSGTRMIIFPARLSRASVV